MDIKYCEGKCGVCISNGLRGTIVFMIQKDALNILKAGRNVYLTGAAGAGKTHVLNTYTAYLKERGVAVAVTASTGIAATHLGGMTIHSWSGIGIKETLSDFDIELLLQKESLWKRYQNTKILIIDEVSMIAPHMFDTLDRLARAMRDSDSPFGGMQIVLSGDFFQLPPITKNQTIRYVDSADVWKKMDIRVCYLEEQFRQEDSSLEEILSEMRSGEVSLRTEEVFEELLRTPKKMETTSTRLYTHNIDVDEVNNEQLTQLPGKVYTYAMSTRGTSSRVASLCKSILAPEKLELKKNAAVMFVKNNFEEGYVNGTLGTVVGFEKNTPIVKTRAGKKIYVTDATWEVVDDGKVLASATQLPLRLAWAITVHKSQGMSLDAAEIDLSKSFVAGQGYVALSRLRSLEGLTLLGLNNKALAVDPYVLELNTQLLNESSKWTKVIGRFSEDDFKEMHDDFIIQSGGTTDPYEIEKIKSEEKEQPEEKVSTYEKTKILILEGKNLKKIAEERGMTIGTIISHLEKLKKTGSTVTDLKKFKPKPDTLKEIKAAFKGSKDNTLAPVHKKLKGKYSYEELRLARLFL